MKAMSETKANNTPKTINSVVRLLAGMEVLLAIALFHNDDGN